MRARNGLAYSIDSKRRTNTTVCQSNTPAGAQHVTRARCHRGTCTRGSHPPQPRRLVPKAVPPSESSDESACSNSAASAAAGHADSACTAQARVRPQRRTGRSSPVSVASGSSQHLMQFAKRNCSRPSPSINRRRRPAVDRNGKFALLIMRLCGEAIQNPGATPHLQQLPPVLLWPLQKLHSQCPEKHTS